MGMSLRQWLINRKDRHEGVHKYVRKPHHKKKQLSDKELAKKHWREYKKLKRDRARGRDHFDYSELYREENNRAYRRWVKERISHYDYDLERKWKKHSFKKVDWVW